MHEIKKYLAVWQNKRFMMVVVAFLALSGVALGSRIPMITSLIEEGINGPELTIIARADGTLDIKEFAIQNQWFAPDVIGAGLKITAVRRFGRNVKLGNVSVMVQADPGVKDETIRTALISIG
ncbi:MAG: hypothetical protein H8F28_14075, partial [Fibrella sp.]|nr:hypothetical protein [Armatimonadota bacterium]